MLSEDLGVQRDSNSQNASSLGSECPFSHSPTLTASLLARTPTSPCLGRKPKAKVATNDVKNACDKEDGDECVKAKFVQLIGLVIANFTKNDGLDP